MKGEINRDYYCSAMLYKGACFPRNTLQVEHECESRCPNHHHKWPTPEQFKEEYGEYWKGAYYSLQTDDENAHWRVDNIFGINVLWPKYVVCACTPWGKPPDNWRPE